MRTERRQGRKLLLTVARACGRPQALAPSLDYPDVNRLSRVPQQHVRMWVGVPVTTGHSERVGGRQDALRQSNS